MWRALSAPILAVSRTIRWSSERSHCRNRSGCSGRPPHVVPWHKSAGKPGQVLLRTASSASRLASLTSNLVCAFLLKTLEGPSWSRRPNCRRPCAGVAAHALSGEPAAIAQYRTGPLAATGSDDTLDASWPVWRVRAATFAACPLGVPPGLLHLELGIRHRLDVSLPRPAGARPPPAAAPVRPGALASSRSFLACSATWLLRLLEVPLRLLGELLFGLRRSGAQLCSSSCLAEIPRPSARPVRRPRAVHRPPSRGFSCAAASFAVLSAGQIRHSKPVRMPSEKRIPRLLRSDLRGELVVDARFGLRIGGLSQSAEPAPPSRRRAIRKRTAPDGSTVLFSTSSRTRPKASRRSSPGSAMCFDQRNVANGLFCRVSVVRNRSGFRGERDQRVRHGRFDLREPTSDRAAGDASLHRSSRTDYRGTRPE